MNIASICVVRMISLKRHTKKDHVNFSLRHDCNSITFTVNTEDPDAVIGQTADDNMFIKLLLIIEVLVIIDKDGKQLDDC